MRFLASMLMCIGSMFAVGCSNTVNRPDNTPIMPSASVFIHAKDPSCIFNCVDQFAPITMSDDYREIWFNYKCPTGSYTNNACLASLREIYNTKQDIIQATLTESVENCCVLYCNNDPNWADCMADAYIKFFDDSFDNQRDFLNAVGVCCEENPV